MGGKKPLCFVSHDYLDPAVEVLKKLRLPQSAEPFIFPRIAEKPDIGIAGPLMEAIRNCDLLTYINTDRSLERFYVGFERSYAARLGKPVYAFRPETAGGLFTSPFKQDMTPARDPLVSLLINLQVKDDISRMLMLLKIANERHNMQFLGRSSRQVDDEPRHLLDSVDDMEIKLKQGAIALLFLSTESVEAGFHDYADAFTAHRAKKDFDTPTGSTSRRFAALPPERTMVIWLDTPNPARIEAALAKFEPDVWRNYISIVRSAAHDGEKLTPVQPDGRPNHVHLDYMIARACWQAMKADPLIAADYSAKLEDRARLAEGHYQQFGINRPGML